MKEMFESLLIAVVALAVIALTGWVFYLTRNPFSFLIPFCMPLVHATQNKE